MFNTVVIIQARMGSNRLPGKVLEDIGGVPMLQRVYDRCCQIPGIDGVVVATSFSEADRQILHYCESNRIICLRGGASEADVLGRFEDVAICVDAKTIIRVSGDCPCLDPVIAGKVLALFVKEKANYASNRLTQPFEDGLDVEVVSIGFLKRAAKQAIDRSDREHVTPWIQREAAEISILQNDHKAVYKWSVDTQEELDHVREIYAVLGEDFTTQELVTWEESGAEAAIMREELKSGPPKGTKKEKKA